MAKAVLTFALYQGEDFLRRETISQDIVKVGKDAKSHLRVDDELASRMHAVVEVGAPDDITLIDLGNEPGTLVNGAKVNKCKLQVGDQILVGNTKIVLESAEAAGAEAQPAAATGTSPFAAGAAGSAPFAASSNPFAAAASASSPFAAASNPFEVASNPFARPASSAHALAVPDDAPPGTYTYTLIKSGPDVNPDEVELPNVQAVEVMVLWGTNVLFVEHLTPPRNFYLGEEGGKNVVTDFFMPAEKLGGVTRMPLVIASGGGAAVVIPQGAKGTIDVPGKGLVTVEEARASGQPCAEAAGAVQYPLPGGAKAKIEFGDFVFQVGTINAGKKVIAGVGSSVMFGAMGAYFALSALAVGGLIGAMAYFKPPMGLDGDESIDKNQLYLMQQYLNAAAEREQKEKETEEVAQNNADNKEGGTGTKAKGEEGSMGNPTTKATNKRYAVQGPANNPDPHLARQAALREATEFGMIGLLASGAAGDPNAPTAPWGRDTSSGLDEVSARGNMWGDEIGDAFGAGGLGLSGIGEGGGGRGEGIGLGSIGTLGHGAGTGTGQGFGSGHGRLGGAHTTKTPKVRMGATQVSGKLPPEVIQRIVRQNYGRFRMCYEQGLARNPSLEGRVSVRFVIGRDGAVSNVSNGGSDLPDGGVVSCVVRAYYGLSFPQPEGGIVTVVYPIMFSPG